MKPLIFVFTLLFSVGLFAQDTSIEPVKTPRIITKLPIEKRATVNGVAIKFLSVVSDSRCPKNVNCIWAGEVIVLVELQQEAQEAIEKTITIGFKRDPTGSETDIIYKNQSFTIKAIKVSPYPEYGIEVNVSDYVLLFDVME